MSKTRPRDGQIREQETDASTDAAEGHNRFPGMSYAEGVSAALRWVLGEESELPYFIEGDEDA